MYYASFLPEIYVSLHFRQDPLRERKYNYKYKYLRDFPYTWGDLSQSHSPTTMAPEPLIYRDSLQGDEDICRVFAAIQLATISESTTGHEYPDSPVTYLKFSPRLRPLI